MQKTRTALTPGLIAIVGFLTVCPVVMLLLGSFSEGLGAFGTFTLSKYVKAYTDPAFTDILFNTVIFTIGSAIVATVLALFLAYLNTRTNIPFKFMFRIISLIPMMVPHILFAVSWVLLLNPSNGMINLFLRQVFGLGGSGAQHLHAPGDDPRGGAPGSAHRLPGHRPRHVGLRRFPGGILQGVRGVESANADAGDPAGPPAGHFGRRDARHRPEPGLLRRSLGDRHAGADLRAGDPHLPYRRDRVCHGLRDGGGGGDERPGRLHHAHLPLSAPDPGRGEIRHRLQPGLPAERDRPQGGPVSPLRDRRAALLCADRPAGPGPLLHIPRSLLHGAEREGLRDDELETLDRGSEGPRLAALPEKQPHTSASAGRRWG